MHAAKLPAAHAEALRPAAAEVAALLRTLGNEDRLLLLCEIAQGERGVSELALRTGIAQPTLSQQLTVLRAQGLVAARRDGKQVFYSIADRRVAAVLATLYRLYCGEK